MKKAAWLLTIVLLVNLIGVNIVQPVFAGEMDAVEFRIGLTSKYSGMSSITVRNRRIEFGYAKDNSFVSNMSLESTSGFTFKPDQTYCYGSTQIYDSYHKVVSAINSITGAGVDGTYLVAAVQGDGQYRVYVSAPEPTTAAMLATSIETKGKVKFEAVTNDATLRMRMSGSFGELLIDVNDAGLYPQIKPVDTNEQGVALIDLGERQYRGRLEVGRYGGSSTLTAVSVVNVEDYLYGVIACEMVPSWEMEALKAQAVCARSYAYVIHMQDTNYGAKKGYALYDTTQSQVYKGYGYEQPKTNEAVDATRGQLVYYNGIAVKAYFYSTSGGHTANSEDVWLIPYPFFRAVVDNTETHQEKKPWIVKKTKTEIASVLDNKGIGVGNVTSLSAQIRTTSGRIYQLKINGTAGSTTLKKEGISSAFSLPSTKVRLIKYGDIPDQVVVQSASGTKDKRISASYVISGDGDVAMASSNLEQYIVISDSNLTNFPKEAPADPETIFFAGMGYGHGVGLSQSGAQSLALQGKNYIEIIKHYYNKVEVR